MEIKKSEKSQWIKWLVEWEIFLVSSTMDHYLILRLVLHLETTISLILNNHSKKHLEEKSLYLKLYSGYSPLAKFLVMKTTNLFLMSSNKEENLNLMLLTLFWESLKKLILWPCYQWLYFICKKIRFLLKNTVKELQENKYIGNSILMTHLTSSQKLIK